MNKGRISYFIVLCLYMAAVSYLCFARPDDIPTMYTYFLGIPFDKVAHFIMFLPFPFLAFMTLNTEASKTGKGLLLSGIAVAGALVAAATEYIQSKISYRSAEPYDLLSDFIGISVGMIVVIVYHITRKHK